jgi:hypothetical protein
VGELQYHAGPRQKWVTLSEKQTKTQRCGGLVKGVECLLSKNKVLSLIPSAIKKGKKKSWTCVLAQASACISLSSDSVSKLVHSLQGFCINSTLTEVFSDHPDLCPLYSLSSFILVHRHYHLLACWTPYYLCYPFPSLNPKLLWAINLSSGCLTNSQCLELWLIRKKYIWIH